MSALASNAPVTKHDLAGGLLAGLLCAGVALWSADAAAQEIKSGKIPSFAPAANVGWLSAGTEWLPMPTGPRPVTHHKDYPYVPNNRGQQPTFRVADVNNPILKPWVAYALKQVNDRVLAGKDAFPPQVRCWPLGVPGFLLYPAQPVFMIQTSTKITMTWQADQMVRRIYLTDKHSPNVKPSWFGESIGHYENGDTLVVDTIGINTRTVVDNYRTPHTEQLHVVERFKLAADEKSIDVTVTVDDPGAFNMPWSARQRYRRVEGSPMLEATCIEGNFNYYDFDLEPVPHADKPDF